MGVNAVAALLDHSPERIVRGWVSKSSKRIEKVHETLLELGVPVEPADDRALDRRAAGVRHQGVIVEFRASEPLGLGDLQTLLESASNPLILVLDGVTDPHNLGACMRSAAAAGAVAVVVPRDRAAGLTPVARRAAAGAAELIPLVAVTNLARALAALADQGLWRVGLAGQGESSLYQADLAGPLALIAGSEERGLRRLTREHCDQLVCIPMAGPTDSLNVSVAAGIALFEALRVRST
ncbi:MAG: 23S rRNA (guanosine(2251)-2'-O)-methyltransferase RlmB [Wenzhouxiangella sp.]|nr:MAG: 23S rRNA (guanosine(2251)-2'-O)-methyltransferase RlmB [Wenzhouxiangella sp.]